MAEELGEKTELPTSKRRRDARARGQVAKSHDFSSAIDLVGTYILLLILGGSMVAGLAAIVRHLLDPSISGVGMNMAEIDLGVRFAAKRVVMVVGPFILLVFVVVLLGQFTQVGLLFTLEPIRPKLDRLSPIAGIGRLFSLRNVVKTGTGLVKLMILSAIAAMIVRKRMPEIVALPRLDTVAAFAAMGQIIADLCIWMLAVMFIIGIADFIYQRWQQTRDLKMTKQEIKEELRSMEGDLETKGRRLRMARQMALQRLRQTVPTADVIVTNPTHFSVALQYDPDKMAAPKVVAKGADFMAFRIREIASANRIPIIERPPLARALYANVDVGKTISTEYFEAVAEILAYVYRLEGKQPVAA